MLILINRNMRCIEIQRKQRKHIIGTTINRNMRCIEIAFFKEVNPMLYD